MVEALDGMLEGCTDVPRLALLLASTTEMNGLDLDYSRVVSEHVHLAMDEYTKKPVEGDDESETLTTAAATTTTTTTTPVATTTEEDGADEESVITIKPVAKSQKVSNQVVSELSEDSFFDNVENAVGLKVEYEWKNVTVTSKTGTLKLIGYVRKNTSINTTAGATIFGETTDSAGDATMEDAAASTTTTTKSMSDRLKVLKRGGKTIGEAGADTTSRLVYVESKKGEEDKVIGASGIPVAILYALEFSDKNTKAQHKQVSFLSELQKELALIDGFFQHEAWGKKIEALAGSIPKDPIASGLKVSMPIDQRIKKTSCVGIMVIKLGGSEELNTKTKENIDATRLTNKTTMRILDLMGRGKQN
jgi:hypothetical protein